MKTNKVVIALSGGVDSSVAAFLLKKKGYDLIGLFMKNWHDETVTISDECPWLDDSNDAMLIAEKLGIPFQTVDLSKEYHSRIIDYMFNEYENGRTPNPDVLCNREIKFDVFLEIALGLGAVKKEKNNPISIYKESTPNPSQDRLTMWVHKKFVLKYTTVSCPIDSTIITCILPTYFI